MHIYTHTKASKKTTSKLSRVEKKKPHTSKSGKKNWKIEKWNMLCSVLCVNIRWIWVLYGKKSVCTLKENMVDAYTLHIPTYYTVSKELVNFSILWQCNEQNEWKLSSVRISDHTQHVLDIRARFRRLHSYVLEHIFYSWNALRTALGARLYSFW